MTKKNLLVISTIALASITFGTLINLPVNAVSTTTTGNSQALEIGPVALSLEADPGQTIKTQIMLRDISSNKLIVSNQIDDFIANGEDGTPKLLVDSTEVSPYSIKNWVSPLAQFTLNPKQVQTIPVTIKVPANASPGGHYGVIRFSGKAPGIDGTGVSLSASLGTLVLLKVKGPVTEKMSLVEFGTSQNKKTSNIFEATPINLFVRLKNEGNVHEQPSGQIAIYDMFGKAVAGVNVNMPPKNVLPSSIRRFDQELDKSSLGNKVLFGRYTANLKLKYGSSSDIITKTITFWIIPYRLILAIVIIVIGAITSLIFVIKRYNRFIINKAQGITKEKKVKRTRKNNRKK